MPRLAPAQRAYALAKSAYQAAYQTVDADLETEFPEGSIPDDAWHNPATTPLLDRYIERMAELSTQRGVPKLRELLRKAEDCLLEWGHGKVQRMPGYSQDIKALFEVANRRADVREKLINLTFKLSA